MIKQKILLTLSFCITATIYTFATPAYENMPQAENDQWAEYSENENATYVEYTAAPEPAVAEPAPAEVEPQVETVPPAEAPAPKPQAKAKTYSNLRPVSTYSKTYQLILDYPDDDPADKPDPRDDNVSARPKVQANAQANDAETESTDSKPSFRIGLYLNAGYLSSDKLFNDKIHLNCDNGKGSDSEFGLRTRLILNGSLFMSVGASFGAKTVFADYSIYWYDYYLEDYIPVKNKISNLRYYVGIPITAGYSLGGKFNIEAGTKISTIINGTITSNGFPSDPYFNMKDDLNKRDNFKETITAFLVGASFQLSEKTELGLSATFASDEKTVGLTFSYWIH